MRSLTAGFAGLTPQTRRFLAGSALMGVAQAVPWTMLPLYLDRLGYTKAQIGAVQSCDAWGMVLIALPAAFLLAHRRTPPILTWASLIAGLAYCALPWMPNLKLVMLLNLVAGLAWSVHYVAISPFLYRHTEAAQRTAVFGLAEAVHTAAAVAGMFLGGRAVELLTRLLSSEKSALAWVVASGGMLALLAILPSRRSARAGRRRWRARTGGRC